MDVAKLIADRRAALQLSRSKFGRLLGGIEGATIYAWETGKARPDHTSLCALVQLAGMDPATLLGQPGTVDLAAAGLAA